MSMDLGRATNKGTALLKLAHQFQQEVILRDEYINWFFDEPTISSLQNNPPDFDSEPRDDYNRILKQSYWYAILREKQGDELIERAIQAGCRQVLLLGAGYETRFFRIQAIKKNAVNTFEVDLPVTIDNKRRCLIKRLGHYIFGMYSNEMKAWLYDKGFQDIKIQEPGDLEFKYLHRRTLPENMWYVVTIKKS